jgi:hypothetical protein
MKPTCEVVNSFEEWFFAFMAGDYTPDPEQGGVKKE